MLNSGQSQLTKSCGDGMGGLHIIPDVCSQPEKAAPGLHSIIGPAMRGRILIHPVRFLPAHSFSPWNFASGSRFVEGTRQRAVTKRLGPVAHLAGVPVVNDHLHRHAAAPDAAPTLLIISPGSQAAASSLPIRRQVRRCAVPGRYRGDGIRPVLDHPQL